MTAKTFVPRPYQSLALNFMHSRKRSNLWAAPGMGKTGTGLMLVDAMKVTGELTKPVLVLGPLRVARDVWPAEPRKWENLQHLSVRPIVGTEDQRRRMMRAKLADIYTINYENLPWLVDVLGESWPFQMVFADESSRLQGFRTRQGGQRAAALRNVAHAKTRYWHNLTGTPASNGLDPLWGQCWFVDQGAALGHTHSDFKNRWFRKKHSGYGIEAMPYADKQIHEAVKPFSLTLKAKDWFDISDPIITPIFVDLPPEARKAYDELEKALYTQLLTGEEIEVFNEAALVNKCSQAANGAVYTEYPKWVKLHDEKIDALDSVIEENGTPVLVAYQFKSDLQRILQRYGKRAALLSTPKSIDDFCKGKIEIGVAHPKSMGHGVDGLQHATNVLIRYGHGWSLEERDQMVERIGPTRQAQAGYDREVRIYDIICRNTVDEDIIARHETKRGVQELLLESCRRRH